MSDDPFQRILAGTAAHTGEAFFRSLVENLASVLGTRGAWVTEYLEPVRRLRALAFWFDTGFIDDYEYHIEGTPCERVIDSKKLFHIPDNLIKLFPGDPDLVQMNGVSYLGAPLLDTDGTILGHLSVLHDAVLPGESRLVTLFNIFAARAASELRRMRQVEAVREREIKLSRLVNSAMDAIIEFDSDLRITRTNTSFSQIFRCKAEEHEIRFLSRFLPDDSAVKLKKLMADLGQMPDGQRYMWVPGGLKAACPGGETFDAEATLSCYVLNGTTYYSLILRNVTDRIEAERRILTLEAEAEYLKSELRSAAEYNGISGRSRALLQVLRDVDQVAPTDANVLIIGETGTGKELIARAVHEASRRQGKPLIKVNCAAIPAALMESEFFGHEKGAFTGATSKREGRFSLAHGGTIFLDEIGELPLDLQAKLLRVLQEGEFEQVGSSLTVKVDVRVVAATNRDLLAHAREGRFREDLYYRLNVFPIHLPPLRERAEDIPELARVFVENLARKTGRPAPALSATDLQRLMRYDWPGNVRELQNVMERAFITGTDGRINLDRALPETPAGASAAASNGESWSNDGVGSRSGNSGIELEKEMGMGMEDVTKQGSDALFRKVRTAVEMEDLERRNLVLALESCKWKVSGPGGAAELIGVPPTTLSSRMRALGIRRG
jgi:PAS domain S-box-containing protein